MFRGMPVWMLDLSREPYPTAGATGSAIAPPTIADCTDWKYDFQFVHRRKIVRQ